MKKRPFGALLVIAALAGGAVAPPLEADEDVARRAQAWIAGLDYDEARRELASADPDDPVIARERALLALYELDCDGAAAILARPEVQKVPGGEQLADIARGCQRVTASLAVDVDPARGIEVRWQDEHDRPLAPLLFETVAAAREALTRDLKVDWPRPTRVVVVRDLLSLSAMTGLPYRSAQTTGTVAVAKWGRVTLLSPRASRHGYAWRDTVAHELTHLAVTRASRDRAPLWLQEGVAKREEVRWRDPGPFDDRPPADAVVARGQELKLTLPLDRLGPSIAMLPSADAAAVAFAEVTSFIRFYVHEEGEGALPALLAELKDGKDADEALLAASGGDLKAWDQRWRSYRAEATGGHAAASVTPGWLGLGADRKGGGEKALAKLRERSRLAELLMGRSHAAEALVELDRANGEVGKGPLAPDAWAEVTADPSLRRLRARALEALGRREREEAQALVADPADVATSFAPWWATRGRWARLSGDEPRARASFLEAVSADPFDAEGACETTDDTGEPADPAKAPLCAAARETREPPFDD